ncbi:MAG: NAD(P) transhydrogenase subunit alpha [Phycisphaeraceae bacterium]
MKIWVPRQNDNGETRAALVPAVVKKFTAKHNEVLVQSGAGVGSHHLDQAYVEAGAAIVPDGDAMRQWAATDVVVVIHPPTAEQAGAMREGAVLVGMFAPLKHIELVKTLASRQVTAFAMEFIPRTTRAQSMDVLSSQANMAGYKAVLLAAAHSPRMFPMMITAAGTISPAKVFVIGAGVAGLQAIATAKRLGAVVEAFDVRAVVEEQVKSLGARFVKLPVPAQDAQTTGGYAKEQTEEERKKQAELMAKHVIGADCTITTAAIFGKAPPLLIPRDVVTRMKSGSVIIDLAADVDAGRGNCEATQPGKRYTTDEGVFIDGTLNLAATVAVDASQAYANNMHSFISEFAKDGKVELNLEEEIQKGACITHGGEIRNEMVRKACQ